MSAVDTSNGHARTAAAQRNVADMYCTNSQQIIMPHAICPIAEMKSLLPTLLLQYGAHAVLDRQIFFPGATHKHAINTETMIPHPPVSAWPARSHLTLVATYISDVCAPALGDVWSPGEAGAAACLDAE